MYIPVMRLLRMATTHSSPFTDEEVVVLRESPPVQTSEDKHGAADNIEGRISTKL